MNISQATAERFIELCEQNGITINKLATISGVTQSTVNDICDGLDISISEFFDTEVFRSLEQEMY